MSKSKYGRFTYTFSRGLEVEVEYDATVEPQWSDLELLSLRLNDGTDFTPRGKQEDRIVEAAWEDFHSQD